MKYFTGDFETDCYMMYMYLDEMELFTTQNRQKYNKDKKRPISNVYGTTQFSHQVGWGGKKTMKEKDPNGGYKTKLKSLYPEYEEIFNEFVDEYVGDFTFNQVVINKNFEIQPHRDAKNVGVSYIIGLGDYTGGKLCIDNGDYTEKINILNKFYTFNGREKLHGVEPFQGTRYSVVFYNNNFNYK